MIFRYDDARRQGLLAQLGVDLSPSGEWRIGASIKCLADLLLAARVHCLSNDEIYFLQSSQELHHPLNHRNEAAAVSLLLQRLPPDSEAASLRQALSQHCEALWPAFSSGDALICGEQPSVGVAAAADSSAGQFSSWAEAQGVRTAIHVASFGGLRGCAAVRDVAPGESILSIPQNVLIYDDTVRETDLGRMLSALPGLSADNVLVIFTLIDRWDEDSRWAPFWRSLPSAYYTGLSFPDHVVSRLEGTAAHLEIVKAQAHLREQYEATRPLLEVLLQTYPQYLAAAWFTYECYVWAAELWYGYAFEIEFPPAPKSKTVMVPFACLVNHSPWPHCVRYGCVNAATRTLDYPAFRPCAAGTQAFISYGPVPNVKLLAYYGFVLPDNPHDLVAMQLEAPDRGLRPSQQAAMEKWGLGWEHNLRNGPLARPLLACLRVIAATDEELVAGGQGSDPRDSPLTTECERQALAMLREAVVAMLGPVHARLEELGDEGGAASSGQRNENGFDADWRESSRFCKLYLEGQRCILQRALQECDRIEGGLPSAN